MIALATTSKEASWLRSLLLEIPTWKRLVLAIPIHCDSIIAIAKVQNCHYNNKRRQIRRKHNTIRKFLTIGAIIVDHVRTDDNLALIFLRKTNQRENFPCDIFILFFKK